MEQAEKPVHKRLIENGARSQLKPTVKPSLIDILSSSPRSELIPRLITCLHSVKTDCQTLINKYPVLFERTSAMRQGFSTPGGLVGKRNYRLFYWLPGKAPGNQLIS